MRGPRSTRRRRSLTAWSATRPVLSLETGWAKGLSSNDFGSGGGPAGDLKEISSSGDQNSALTTPMLALQQTFAVVPLDQRNLPGRAVFERLVDEHHFAHETRCFATPS